MFNDVTTFFNYRSYRLYRFYRSYRFYHFYRFYRFYRCIVDYVYISNSQGILSLFYCNFIDVHSLIRSVATVDQRYKR